MALKFNKQSLEDFHERLSSVDASWQEDFNLKEIVRKSLKPISKARRYKVSWEKIALMLQEATGGELEISAASVRQYYFELMEKTLKKETAKSNKNKSEKKQDKSGNTQAKNSEIQEAVSDKETEIISEASSQSSEESHAESLSDTQVSSEAAPPEFIQESSENLSAIPPKTSEKSRRKPQSEIQSSFNLRRR
ncbi:hypothetical protein [Almyronema epifaneia]|uniref:Uncharacterized protein n=1 Tax=Almyronema epifaneia S1 TaxID=2991925 RepID=A0ABW6ICT0_9CYAN